MATGLVNIIADFQTSLAASVIVGATTATLSSATDDDGDALPTGTYGFTIDRKSSAKEYIECTLTGTALTAISTVDLGTGVATSGFARAHRKGAEVIISDFVAIKRHQDILESGYAGAVTPASNYALATKKYVDDIALGGTTTIDRFTVAGTAGETVSAGHVLYLKVSDGRWWKADGDLIATLNGVQMGIAQGSGTAGNAITSGVLLRGVDSNQSGGTIGAYGYVSNTPGAVSTTVGTLERVVGQFKSSTTFYFDPDFYGTPVDYSVDAVGTDAYAITPTPAIHAYTLGQRFTFKAGTANTGPATLAVSGLSATAITKFGATALATGDILANQVVTVVYDGTQFQIVSVKPVSEVIGIAQGGTGLSAVSYGHGVTTRAMDGASAAVTIAHGLGVAPKRIRVTARVVTTADQRLATSDVYITDPQQAVSTCSLM